MPPDRDSLEPGENRVDGGPEAGRADPDLDIDDDDAENADLTGDALTDEALTDEALTDEALTDEAETDEAEGALESPPPGKLESWRKRSATGAVLTGLALGFQQVFEKEREEPAIIMTTSGDPPRDLPVEAEVEHGRPRRAVVNIRPWLLDRGGSGAGSDAAAGSPPDAETDDRTRRDDQPPAGSRPEGD